MEFKVGDRVVIKNEVLSPFCLEHKDDKFKVISSYMLGVYTSLVKVQSLKTYQFNYFRKEELEMDKQYYREQKIKQIIHEI